MVKCIKILNNLVEHLTNWFFYLAIFLLCMATLVVLAEITMRYFFNSPIRGSVEITEYCLLWIVFLAGAWVLKEDGHVKIDLLSNRLTKRYRNVLDIVISIICMCICLTLTIFSVKVTFYYYEIQYVLSSTLKPLAYLLIIVLPIGLFMLFVQFIKKLYIQIKNYPVQH